MNAHVGLHLHEPLRIRIEMIWRRLFAGSAILLLAGIGILTAWREAHPFGLERFLFALVVTLAPAAAYAFAYFQALPEVLGEECTAQKSSLLQRWSDFARLTSAIAIIITWICWAAIIVKHFHGITLSLKQLPSMVDVFVLGTLTTRPDLCTIGALLAAAIMTMCVVASEEYLARTMGQMVPLPATGWRNSARWAVGKGGAWLGAHLRAKPALVLGSVLLLFSLVARMDLFGGYGLQVVSGHQTWPTAEYTLVGTALTILSQAGRWMYVAALGIALLGLGAVAMRRPGDRLRRSYVLVFLSTAVALFAVCDLHPGSGSFGFDGPECAECCRTRSGLGIADFCLGVASARRQRALGSDPDRGNDSLSAGRVCRTGAPSPRTHSGAQLRIFFARYSALGMGIHAKPSRGGLAKRRSTPLHAAAGLSGHDRQKCPFTMPARATNLNRYGAAIQLYRELSVGSTVVVRNKYEAQVSARVVAQVSAVEGGPAPTESSLSNRMTGRRIFGESHSRQTSCRLRFLVRDLLDGSVAQERCLGLGMSILQATVSTPSIESHPHGRQG